MLCWFYFVFSDNTLLLEFISLVVFGMFVSLCLQALVKIMGREQKPARIWQRYFEDGKFHHASVIGMFGVYVADI